MRRLDRAWTGRQGPRLADHHAPQPVPLASTGRASAPGQVRRRHRRPERPVRRRVHPERRLAATSTTQRLGRQRPHRPDRAWIGRRAPRLGHLEVVWRLERRPYRAAAGPQVHSSASTTVVAEASGRGLLGDRGSSWTRHLEVPAARQARPVRRPRWARRQVAGRVHAGHQGPRPAHEACYPADRPTRPLERVAAQGRQRRAWRQQQRLAMKLRCASAHCRRRQRLALFARSPRP